MWYGIYADQVMDGMATNDIVAVLLPYLKSEHKETRRLTVYYLGLRRTPEHATQVLPFLDDEEASGAAIRTLGKWQVSNAVERIATFLGDAKERKRVLAANALGDIRDPRAVPALIRALGDPFFTVRKAAAKALTALGSPAEKELLDSLKTTEATQRREIIQTLGAMRSRDAIPSLRALLNNPDQGTRTDAAIALTAIAPKETPEWIKGTQAEGLVTATGMVSNE
jgi:HEAT repeat protein